MLLAYIMKNMLGFIFQVYYYIKNDNFLLSKI